MNIRSLVIYGAGGHGKVVLDLAKDEFSRIAFIDDTAPAIPADFRACPLLGTSAELESARRAGYTDFVVCIGTNRTRAECYRKALSVGLAAAVLVHPSAVVSPSAVIGGGTVVLPRAVINADAVIGENCIVNTGVIVEHDCKIGDHVHLSPSAVLGGGVKVRSFAHVGLGAIALPGADIGEGAIIGAGAVVIASIPRGATAVGIPAKVLTVSS